MKERLLKLYELNKIDKELQEIKSLKGDLPAEIEQLRETKTAAEVKRDSVKNGIEEIETGEKTLLDENEKYVKKIDKNDNLLRSGAVKTNEEYNALAREIEDAYEKISKNDDAMGKDLKTKKAELIESLTGLQQELDTLTEQLAEKEEELKILNTQTEEEETELLRQREVLLPQIDPDDLNLYDRVNKSKFGDSFAIVRKGSCLGCFNSIPPQRSIEIRMADRFFNCESCGRILIAEELINESQKV